MGAHSILAPSAAAIWGSPFGCTGHVTMAQKYPQPDDPLGPAAEGNAAHIVAAAYAGAINDPLEKTWPLPVIGDPINDNFTVTEEMIEGAELYATDFHSVGRTEQYGIEETLPIHAIHKDCFGTVDAWKYFPALKILYVWDYKFGFKPVDAFENPQGICYIAGLMRKLNVPHDTTVIFRIVQPRNYRTSERIKEWVTTIKDLLLYIGVLTVKAAQALDPKRYELNTGPHCRYCYPRFKCPAAIEAGLTLYESVREFGINELAPDELGRQFDLLDRAYDHIKTLRSSVEEHILALVKNRTVIPGWTTEQSGGKLQWGKPQSEIISLGKLMKIPVEKSGTITPTQAIKAGMPEDVIKAYAGRSPGKTKLVKVGKDYYEKLFNPKE